MDHHDQRQSFRTIFVAYTYNIVGKFSVIWLAQIDPSKHCKHTNLSIHHPNVLLLRSQFMANCSDYQRKDAIECCPLGGYDNIKSRMCFPSKKGLEEWRRVPRWPVPDKFTITSSVLSILNISQPLLAHISTKQLQYILSMVDHYQLLLSLFANIINPY